MRAMTSTKKNTDLKISIRDYAEAGADVIVECPTLEIAQEFVAGLSREKRTNSDAILAAVRAEIERNPGERLSRDSLPRRLVKIIDGGGK